MDEEEGTIIDIYMVALAKINEEGGGSKRENNEMSRAIG